MALKKGDVVLVPIPFTDQSQSKVRPAVILSDTAYNRTKPDVILGAITTNLKGRMTAVDYVLVDWKKANLRYPSAFKPILFTIDPQLIVHRIGALSAADLRAIEKRLVLMFGLKVTPSQSKKK